MNQPSKAPPRIYSKYPGAYLCLYLCLCLLAVFAPLKGALALEDDRDQPVQINADEAIIDEKTREAIYTGNVTLTQGSLTIKAVKLTIYTGEEGRVDRVRAVGNLAQLTQIPEPGKPKVIAKAKVIDYLVVTDEVILTTDAIVIQGDNLFEGQVIKYDVIKQRIYASGANTNAPGSASDGDTKKTRVKMILQPSRSRKNE